MCSLLAPGWTSPESEAGRSWAQARERVACGVDADAEVRRSGGTATGQASRCCSEGIGKHFDETGLLHGSQFGWALVRTLFLLPARQNRYLVSDGIQDKQLNGRKARFDGYVRLKAPAGDGTKQFRVHKTLALASGPIRPLKTRHRPPNESSGCLISRPFDATTPPRRVPKRSTPQA